MSDLDTLNEYNVWVLEQKRKDTSPEAFLIDRAKEQALDRLIEIENELDAFEVIELEEGETLEALQAATIDEIRRIVKE